MIRKTLLSVVLLTGTLLQAQVVDFLLTEYNQSIYQIGYGSVVEEDDYIGMSDLDGWDWPSFTFFAAIDSTTEEVSNAELTGPSFPTGLILPWDFDTYKIELGRATLGALTSAVQPGSYTFSGTGTAGLGAFSEDTTIPVYIPLTNRLVTNFTELQSFDPTQELTISWEEFTEGHGAHGDGTPIGLVEVWIDYWDDDFGNQYVWSHFDLPVEELNDFGTLPSDITSVTIPPNTLVGSQYGYTVDIFFTRIDSFENAQSISGASVAHIRSMDTVLTIYPSNPWDNFTQLSDGWVDTGSWMGRLYVQHAPWIYSENTGQYVYIPDSGVFFNGAWSWIPAPLF